MNFNQSKVKIWRRCEKQYAFRYDYAPDGKEMTPKRATLPLTRGTWMHELLEAHYLEWAGVEDETWQDRHEAKAAQFEELFLEEREELGDLPDECHRLFEAYLRFWGDQEDEYEV